MPATAMKSIRPFRKTRVCLGVPQPSILNRSSRALCGRLRGGGNGRKHTRNQVVPGRPETTRSRVFSWSSEAEGMTNGKQEANWDYGTTDHRIRSEERRV